jgi:hypothetical protein
MIDYTVVVVGFIWGAMAIYESWEKRFCTVNNQLVSVLCQYQLASGLGDDLYPKEPELQQERFLCQDATCRSYPQKCLHLHLNPAPMR